MYGTRGDDCSIGGCPNDCSDNGQCVSISAGDGAEQIALCRCDAGWKGQDCATPGCPICVHGKCDGSKCICEPGFWKNDCSERVCLNNCTDAAHGECNDGTCECTEKFAGEDCSIDAKLCPGNCGNFRGKCTTEGCKCLDKYGGPDCMKECPNDCSGRGTCKGGVCTCEAGFALPDCAHLSCKNGCSGNGICDNGKCMCANGFGGDDCSKKLCPNLCSGRGTCDHTNGTCTCDSFIPQETAAPGRWYLGYGGNDCGERMCLNNCTSPDRGTCDTKSGHCQCKDGFVGESCAGNKCDNKCNGNGHCPDTQTGCVCNHGFKGENCEVPYCVDNCNEHEGWGQCVGQKCECHPTRTGYDCSQQRCPTALPEDSDLKSKPLPDRGQVSVFGADKDPDLLACTRNGLCVNGTCACFQGFEGNACHIKACPKQCSDKGVCEDGKCSCNEGWGGIDCGTRVVALDNNCKNNCSNRGVCRNATCFCEHGKYFGDDCSLVRIPCPDGCALNGRCDPLTGKCHCHPGRAGEDCMTQICAPSVDCSGNGVCLPSDGMFGTCKCKEGFSGPGCADRTCEDTCSGHGQCLNDNCFCEPGYAGHDCSRELCPNSCNGNGQCTSEGCKCRTGYVGDGCEDTVVPCPGKDSNCTAHGQCTFQEDQTTKYGVAAVCHCENGWSGSACTAAYCPKGCNEAKGQGRCALPGQCECSDNYFGETCEKEICPNSCSGHGVCNGLVCECYEGYGGLDCKTKLGCSDECETHGTCIGNSCSCDEGYFGGNCENKRCPNDCSQRGDCAKTGKCECYAGFAGEACQILKDVGVCMASCEEKCSQYEHEETGEARQKAGEKQHLTKAQCVTQCASGYCVPPKSGDEISKVEQLANTIKDANSTLEKFRQRLPRNNDKLTDSSQKSIWW